MTHIFKIVREKYTEQTTLGKLYAPDGSYFGYILEDTVRPFGIKVHGCTAIPGGTAEKPMRYNLGLSMSNRFKREMPIVYTEADKSTLKADGKQYEGIRLHGDFSSSL